ncbi:iron chelate uptake ABC transporter family permease subunit [Candidatus Halobeggiatoa sp. HSG11]|nr:iron chelate uptake ABC transporter family permease subunit [Candidatus Halobeggiatoa sp. HSG11]
MIRYLLLLIVTSIIGISIGSIDIPLDIVLRILIAKIIPWLDTSDITETQQIIIWSIRVPRVLVAALVGASLAIAGVQMQGLFQNPLASPGIVGTSSGGALGAVIALASGLASYSMFYIPIFASGGALLALFTVYMLATKNGNTPVATLLLAGIALNALIAAMTSLIITVVWVEHDIAREIVFWLMGGLDNRTWSHVWITLPGILTGIILAMVYTRELDILLIGQETAYSLGVEVERVQRIILLSTALLTGTAVAVSGVVGFVGLIIPHIVRLFVGPKHRYLIPLSAIIGAIFLIIVDLLARTINSPTEIRLGILTAVFGAPFFLYLLRKHSQL